MANDYNLTSLTNNIISLNNQVDEEYTEFIRVMENSNRFVQAISSSSTSNQLYTNFKALTTNSNVSIVQDYEYIDTLEGNFQILYNNVALKRDTTTNIMRLNTGQTVSFGIYNNSNVYNSSKGRVAIFDRASGLCLRIGCAAGAITFSPFVPNHWEYSWFICKTASGKYEIQSDWWRGLSTTSIGYIQPENKFFVFNLNDTRRSQFTFGAGMSNNYLTPNNQGLYTRVISSYFNDDISQTTSSNALNTPTMELWAPNISSLDAGTCALYTKDKGTNFTVIWTGYFYAPTTGTYTFYLNSDDASYFWIGSNATSGFTTGNANIKIPGVHAMTKLSTTQSLTATTYYPIRIIYGQGIGGANIIFSWKPPNGQETSTTSGYLFLNPPA